MVLETCTERACDDAQAKWKGGCGKCLPACSLTLLLSLTLLALALLSAFHTLCCGAGPQQCSQHLPSQGAACPAQAWCCGCCVGIPPPQRRAMLLESEGGHTSPDGEGHTNGSSWRQREMVVHESCGFASYSAYRVLPTRIVVFGNGLGQHYNLRQTGTCVWHAPSGTAQPLHGHFRVQQWGPTRHFTGYNVIVFCNFHINAGTVERPEGGLRSAGGHLEISFNSTAPFTVFAEEPGLKVLPADYCGPFPHELVFCGAPAYGTLRVPSMMQFLHYHLYHPGYTHFHLYDAGAFLSEHTEALKPLIARGLVTITDFLGPTRVAKEMSVFYYNQVLGLNDCYMRNLGEAAWVSLHDMDEYLFVVPPHTLSSLLLLHSARPYLSHGCYDFNTDACTAPDVWHSPEQEWAVELLPYRNDTPFCNLGHSHPDPPRVCLNHWGYRKLILNPRKVEWSEVHYTNLPEEEGANIPTTEMYHGHFRMITVMPGPCNLRRTPTWLTFQVNHDIAAVAKQARLHASAAQHNQFAAPPGEAPSGTPAPATADSTASTTGSVEERQEGVIGTSAPAASNTQAALAASLSNPILATPPP